MKHSVKKNNAKKTNAKKKVKENFEAQIERQWKLVKLLSDTPDGLTRKELAEKLQVDERTISRDLVLLGKFHQDLKDTTELHGRKKWFIDNNKKELTFSYDQVAALYISRQFLEPLAKTNIGVAADKVLENIRDRLGSNFVGLVDTLRDAFGATDSTEKYCGDLAEKATIFNQILSGYEDKCQVTVSYRSGKVKEPETYNFNPYRIKLENNTIYIIGHSLKSKANRTLKLDRLVSAQVTKTRFERPDNIESLPFFATPGADPQKAVVLFDQEVACYVQESKQYKPQHVTEQKDGSIIVDYQLPETELFKRWLLGFGSQAELLEPESLRTEIQEEVEKLRKRYAPQTNR